MAKRLDQQWRDAVMKAAVICRVADWDITTNIVPRYFEDTDHLAETEFITSSKAIITLSRLAQEEKNPPLLDTAIHECLHIYVRVQKYHAAHGFDWEEAYCDLGYKIYRMAQKEASDD